MFGRMNDGPDGGMKFPVVEPDPGYKFPVIEPDGGFKLPFADAGGIPVSAAVSGTQLYRP